MATWIAHMRIAEEINKQLNLKENSFLIGNLAPDSGLPNENGTKFDPPREITHWLGENNSIDPESFFNEYLKDIDVNTNDEYHSFLMGYYVHLLTDVFWKEMNDKKRENDPIYNHRIKTEPNFIWEVVKKDWYGLDFKYINDNEENIFNKVLLKIKSVPDYLDYFPKGALTKSVNRITEFYLTQGNYFNKEFFWLTESEMNEFVTYTIKEITDILRCKKII